MRFRGFPQCSHALGLLKETRENAPGGWSGEGTILQGDAHAITHQAAPAWSKLISPNRRIVIIIRDNIKVRQRVSRGYSVTPSVPESKLQSRSHTDHRKV